MARYMRQQNVSAEDVALQLGHRRKEFKVTSVYTGYDGKYLQAAVGAIYLFFCELACKFSR